MSLSHLRRELDQQEVRSNDKAVSRNESLDPALSLELLVGEDRLRLFNTFTTFGTPQDTTLQELRIDLSFPADEPTRRFLAAAAKAGAEKTLN